MVTSTRLKIVLATSLLALVVVAGLVIVPNRSGRGLETSQDSLAKSTLSDVLYRAQQARSYRYSGDVAQTMIPRPVPSMIGQRDQTMTMALEGEVQGTDHSWTTLEFDPGGVNGISDRKSVTIVRDGTQLFTERDGKREPVQNDMTAGASADNALDYLAAAEHPRVLKPQTINGASFQHIAFDLHGDTLIRQQLARFAAAQPGAQASVPETYRNASGSGEIWIDDNGLPKRQEITFEIPNISPEYHARITMRVTFADFSGVPAPGFQAHGPSKLLTAVTSLRPFLVGSWHAVARQMTEQPKIVIAFLMLLVLYLVWYRRDRRQAQAWTTVFVLVAMLSLPSLQAGAAGHQLAQGNASAAAEKLLGLPNAGHSPAAGASAPRPAALNDTRRPAA